VSAGPNATKVAVKEAVALGRLNERVPPTPYVVRLLEAASTTAEWQGDALDLPWLVLEYVHGGPAGTTLTERVASTVQATGYAFDSARAMRAVHCLGLGLAAVHEVGVIHRDLKPDNVLCCGAGPDEIFKVADFGIARPVGVAATFHGGAIGTIGYVPPEVIDGTAPGIGPWTDVFALASMTYFLLTSEEYFKAGSLVEAVAQVMAPMRRSLLDAPRLSPDLRDREVACRAIDAALAQATDRRPEQRHQSAPALSAAIMPWLRTDSWRQRSTARPTATLAPPPIAAWSWLVRRRAADDLVVRSAGWDADGTCLVATTRGIAFWDGTRLREAPSTGLPSPRSVRFVTRVSTGRWLVACDASTFAMYTQHGVREVMRFSDESPRLELFSGDIGDLAVGVGRSQDGLCMLALSGRRWLRPLPVPEVAAVVATARVEDTKWLVVGRDAQGCGWAALYSPLEWELERLDVPVTRAMLACAADMQTGAAVAVGAEGVVVSVSSGAVVPERLPHLFDASAAAVDPSGGAWVAGAGRIARRQGAPGAESWEVVWEDSRETVPIVSLFADTGLLVAITADGAVFEGRSTRLSVVR
jgi:hypothetical protein